MDNLTTEKLHTLTSAIDRLLMEKPQILLAIDGPCTAGKTTLAALLHQQYGCNVIHMDEFFLHSEQRTPERLAQPGGNVDYERFLRDVLTPLAEGKVFSYRPFSCAVQALSLPREIHPTPLTVVEGTYAVHPCFGNPYDLRIFLTVDAQTQRERIGLRENWKQERFFREWIPMEQQYFDHFSIREKCDLVL